MRPLILTVALASASAAYAQHDFSGVEIKVTKVAGNVYMLEGAGGNIGVSAGEDGILIVDSQFYPLAPKIKAALKGIVDKPVRFVLNTHHHGDHTSGNPAHVADGAEVVAHANVRKRMAQEMADKENPMSGLPVSALPVISFTDSLSVHFNGEEIRALHLPNGHTDGDSAILFTRSKVLHLGDQLFTGRFPYVDADFGGTVTGYIANLERILREAPKDVKVIPGHGDLGTLDDVRATVKMLKETRAVIAAAVKKGKTAEQLKKEKALAKWDAFAWEFITADRMIDQLVTDVRSTKR